MRVLRAREGRRVWFLIALCGVTLYALRTICTLCPLSARDVRDAACFPRLFTGGTVKQKEPLTSLSLIEQTEIIEDIASRGFTPTSFDSYEGQSEIKEKLTVYTQAARMRLEALDHVLLFGPPGLGKTTLATIIASELGVSLKVTSAPVIERAGDLVALLSSLQERDVLFIDEIHRLPKVVEEVLYTAMEQFAVDMIVGQGAGASAIRLPLAPFTLIGATTKTGMLSGPLQTRFGIIERLQFYSDEALAGIIIRNGESLGCEIDLDAALEIGMRSRGTPRIAKRLLRRVRDFAQVKRKTRISKLLVDEALLFLGIDADGLTDLDRKVLSAMLTHYEGGPVGLETIAALTGEDAETLEDFCEPFLMRQGLLQKTPRGRVIPIRKIPLLKKRLLGYTGPLQEGLFGE